jgi:polyhydroxyalkanoate synthase
VSYFWLDYPLLEGGLDESGFSPWEDFFFQFEGATGASSEAAQAAYGRAVEGSNAIVRSLDVPVGLSPKDLVWQLNKAKLYRYRPSPKATGQHRVPLLLVYALINKPFILDLVPGRSFIEHMLENGFDVFLLDWGLPGLEDQHTSFDDYVTQYLYRAVRKVLRICGAGELSLLGYCLGATLTVTFAGLYPEVPLRNIILLTAPLDFSGQPEGSMTMWLEGLDVDKMVDALGNIPGELIRHWAKLLKPVENFVGAYVNLWKLLGNESAVWGWQAINRWVEDVVPVAGAAFRQFAVDYVRDNKLVKGELVVDGRRVELANIDAALLNIVAKYDHLVAPAQATSIMEMVSSTDKEIKVIPSTHVGIVISQRAKYKLWPEVSGWLGERSD